MEKVEILQQLNEFEKRIYNTFLRVSRSRQNKPFSYRKDFTKFPDKDYVSVKKISNFLNKFSYIDLEDFLVAPYKVYSDTEYFELEFYVGLKAVNVYSLYKKQQSSEDIDSPEQLINIKKSLIFIRDFCKDQNIQVSRYITHKTGSSNSYILHLKEYRVNLYTLFGFSEFEDTIKKENTDVLRFILGEDILDKLSLFKVRYLNSNKARVLVEEGLKKLNKHPCITNNIH